MNTRTRPAHGVREALAQLSSVVGAMVSEGLIAEPDLPPEELAPGSELDLTHARRAYGVRVRLVEVSDGGRLGRVPTALCLRTADGAYRFAGANPRDWPVVGEERKLQSLETTSTESLGTWLRHGIGRHPAKDWFRKAMLGAINGKRLTTAEGHALIRLGIADFLEALDPADPMAPHLGGLEFALSNRAVAAHRSGTSEEENPFIPMLDALRLRFRAATAHRPLSSASVADGA